MTKSARPTMRDVAGLAGVSLKSVSRVVNGDEPVTEALRARVIEAAKQLNYRPNVAANLRGRPGRPTIIGLLIQDVSNEFSASVFRAVEDVAIARKVQVLATNVDEDPERERQMVAALVARRVDGLIVVPAGADEAHLELEQRLGTPVVFADRPPSRLQADAVVSDNREGSRRGVRHLAAHGHRRIAFLGESNRLAPACQRFDGYVEALVELGVAVDERLVRRDLETEAAAREATIELLVDHRSPTAIFSAHNRLTIGAVRGLRDLGRHHEIALVGFDDFALADLLDPPVTVVAQDPGTIGRLAAELLFQRIEGNPAPPAEHVVPTTLISRGTGELPCQEEGP